jgi:hypothetical protein
MVMTAKLTALLAIVHAQGGFSPARPTERRDLVTLEAFGYVEKAGPGLWKVSQSGVDALIAKGARA